MSHRWRVKSSLCWLILSSFLLLNPVVVIKPSQSPFFLINDIISEHSQTPSLWSFVLLFSVWIDVCVLTYLCFSSNYKSHMWPRTWLISVRSHVCRFVSCTIATWRGVGQMDHLRLQATLVVCMCPLKVSYSFLAVNLQFVVKLATADTTR